MFLKKHSKIICLIIVFIAIIYSDLLCADWLHDTFPYRIGIKITKPTATSDLNYATAPIEIIVDFKNYGFSNVDSSSIRVTRNNGITEIPSQTEEWTDNDSDGNYDTCLLIFQIHSLDLNNDSDTTTEYFLYFDSLSSGIKGAVAYSTDLQHFTATRSDTLQNTFVQINVRDTPVVSSIVQLTQSSPNLTGGGIGADIWRNEGMYEINDGAWYGLHHDTQWTRAVRTGPVRIMMTGSDIDFDNAVNPPRVKLTRKWKVYNNYPYFIIDDRAEVVNGPINTIDYDAGADTYWKYSLYSSNLPNLTYKDDTGYTNILASVTTTLTKPYWISMHSPSNYGRAILIKSALYNNILFGLKVDKDITGIGTNPNRCKFYFMNGNTGNVTNYQFAHYVFGQAHNNTTVDNEWKKWDNPLQTEFTRLYKHNPIVSNIQLKKNTGVVTNELTPDTQMLLEFKVEDSDGFSDVDTITIIMYNSRVSSLTDDDNETSHITFRWIEADDTWQIVSPLVTSWLINADACSSPGSGNDTYTAQTLRLVFTPGKTAVYETQPLWNIYVKVESANQDTFVADSINVSCAFFAELTRPPAHSSIEFDTGNPNSIYKNIITPGTGRINYTLLTNGAYRIFAQPQNFNISPLGELNIANDSYLFINFANDTDNAITLRQPNTIQLIDTGLSGSDETGFNKQTYLWMSYPHQADKTYQAQLNLIVSPYYTYNTAFVDTITLTGYTNSGSNPAIGAVKLFTGVDTTVLTDTLTPNTKMTLNIPISDRDRFLDIDTVTVKIFHSSVNADSEDTERLKITIKWSAVDDSLYIENNISGWTIDYSNSVTPGLNNYGLDTQNLKIVFIPSKIAEFDADKNWKIWAAVSSKYPGEQVYADTLNVSCAFYGEINIANVNGMFLKNDTGSIFNPLINPSLNFFSLNFIANGLFNVLIKGTDFISDSAIIEIDSAAALKYNFINDTSSADSVSINDKTILSALTAAHASGIDTNLYMWLDYGDSSGQIYSGTVTISIANILDNKIADADTLYLTGATVGGPDDPQILNLKLYDNSEIETNALTPNTDMLIKMFVSERINGFDDIDTITFYIYHNSCTYLSEDSPALHSTFRWTAIDDSWQILGPQNSSWLINIDSCFAPAGTTDTSAKEIIFGFRVGLTAKYDTQYNWIIMAVVESQIQSENGSSFISAKNNFYGNIIFVDTNGLFQTNNPNSQDNPLETPVSFLKYNVITNGVYDIFYKADNFSGGNGLLLAQNKLSGYHLNNTGLSANIQAGYSKYRQNIVSTEEEGETQQLYLWLDYGADTQTTYNGKIYLAVAPQGYLNFSAFDTASLLAATTAGSQPIIALPQLYNDDNGGTTHQTTVLTPNDEMTLIFEIREFDGITDIDTIFVYFWDSLTADSGMNAIDTAAIFLWSVQSGQRVLSCLTNGWSADTQNSVAPAVDSVDNDSQLFKLVFTPAKTIKYRHSDDWRIAVKAYSKSPGGYNYSDVLNVGDTVYAEIILIDTTIIFNSGAPQTLNNMLKYPYNSAISARLITNAHINFSIKADNFTGGDGINIDAVTNPLTYKLSIDDSIDTVIRTTSSLTRIIPPTDDTGVTINIFPYIDYPNEFAKIYSSQLYLKMDSTVLSPVTSTINLTAATNAPNDPYIRSMQLYADDNGGTTTVINYLTPNDTMTLAAVITDEDGFNDITQVDVHIYHTDYANIESTGSEKYKAVYRWTKASNSFVLLSPSSGTLWAIDTNNCTFFDPYPYDNNFNSVLLPNSNWTTKNFRLADTRYVSSPYSANSTSGANINDTLQVITKYNSASVLTFNWFLISQPNNDNFEVSVNGVIVAGYPKNGNIGGFFTETINLAAGQNRIQFRMYTNPTHHFENVYIDDVKVRPNSFEPNFKLVFKPSKIAEFSELSKWRIDIKAVSASQTNDGRVLNNYPNNFFTEVSYSGDTIYFDTGNPNSILNPVIYNETDYLPVNIITNYAYDLAVNADTFSGGAGISLYNNSLGFDVTENGDWQNRTFIKPDTNYLFMNNAATDTTGVSKKIYLWLDYPNEQNINYTSNLRLITRPYGKTADHYSKIIKLTSITKPYTAAQMTVSDTAYIGENINVIIIDTDAVKSRYHIDSFIVNIKTVISGDTEYFYFIQENETSTVFNISAPVDVEYSAAANIGDGKIQLTAGDSVVVIYTDTKNNNTTAETIPARNILDFTVYSTGYKEVRDSGVILHLKISNNHYNQQSIDTIIITSVNNPANIKDVWLYTDSDNNDTFDFSDNLADSKTLAGNTAALAAGFILPAFGDTDIFIFYKLKNTVVAGDTIDFYIDTGGIISTTMNGVFPVILLNSEGYDTVALSIILSGTVFLEGRTNRECAVILYSSADTYILTADSITGEFIFYLNGYDTYNLKIEQLAYKTHLTNVVVDTDVIILPIITLLGGDLTQSGAVTLDDLGILMYYFGKQVDSPLKGDINNSGWVTEDDYSILIKNLE